MFELLEKMYHEFSSFRKEMTEFKQDMTEFKHEMTEFKQEMTEFKDNTSTRFDQLDKSVHENTTHIEQLHRNVLRVESKLENRIQDKVITLFDAHSFTQDKLEVLDEKLDMIKLDLNSLSIRTAYSDIELLELKRHLKSVK